MDAILHDFYAQLKQGRLVGRGCQDCGTIAFPPRGLCPSCGSAAARWRKMSGRGRLLFAAAGVNLLLESPYVMATIELEEGPIVAGMLLDDTFDFARPETVWDYNGASIPVSVEVAASPRGGVLVACRRLSTQTELASLQSVANPIKEA